MMELLASITKKAIENKIINYKDLYYIDEPSLFKKIKSNNIKELKILMDKFENIKKEEIPVTLINNMKIRNINPLVGGMRTKQIS